VRSEAKGLKTLHLSQLSLAPVRVNTARGQSPILAEASASLPERFKWTISFPLAIFLCGRTIGRMAPRRSKHLAHSTHCESLRPNALETASSGKATPTFSTRQIRDCRYKTSLLNPLTVSICLAYDLSKRAQTLFKHCEFRRVGPRRPPGSRLIFCTEGEELCRVLS